MSLSIVYDKIVLQAQIRLGLFEKKSVKFTVIVNYKQDTKINHILFH